MQNVRSKLKKKIVFLYTSKGNPEMKLKSVSIQFTIALQIKILRNKYNRISLKAACRKLIHVEKI